jgi:osmotically-inducible protein OsmY
MTQPAAFVQLSWQKDSDSKEEVLQKNAQLLAQSVEDLRLAERVARALRATGYAPLRDIEVTVHNGLVILGGWVRSYFLKQMAQANALSVQGVNQVRNDLKVSRPS